MSEKIQISSNKSFGIVFFIVFLLVGLYPLTNGESLNLTALVISLVFLFLGILNSRILTPFNILWFKLGLLLGKIFAPFLMGVIFFLVVTPIALIMRILKKDILNLKLHQKKSYWIEKNGPNSKMKNQF